MQFDWSINHFIAFSYWRWKLWRYYAIYNVSAMVQSTVGGLVNLGSGYENDKPVHYIWQLRFYWN